MGVKMKGALKRLPIVALITFTMVTFACSSIAGSAAQPTPTATSVATAGVTVLFGVFFVFFLLGFGIWLIAKNLFKVSEPPKWLRKMASAYGYFCAFVFLRYFLGYLYGG